MHFQVVSTAQSAVVSASPECRGRHLRHYSVQVVETASGRSRTSAGLQQVFIESRSLDLVVGQEYLALLWFDGSTSDELVLPITAGRVVSKQVPDLNGLSPREALNLLAKWADGRKR